MATRGRCTTSLSRAQAPFIPSHRPSPPLQSLRSSLLVPWATCKSLGTCTAKACPRISLGGESGNGLGSYWPSTATSPSSHDRKEGTKTREFIHASRSLMHRLRNASTIFRASDAALSGAEAGVLDDIAVSFALSRLAKLAKGNKEMLGRGRSAEALRALKDHLLENTGGYRPRSLATALHALAKLSVEDPMVYEMAGRQVCRQAAEYKPQEVSMMLWAFAKSGNANQELFRALGRQVINKAEIFKPQELSMTVWAFATVGISAQTLFMTVEQEAVEKIGYFKPQELATFAWAFARVSHKAPELFLALEGQLLKALSAGSLKTADLSMAVWAFASAGCGSPQLFRSLGSAAAKAAREGRFAGREVSALLWGLATAGHGASEEVLQAFEGRLGGPEGIDLATLRSREVANILWAYAELGHACRLTQELSEVAVASARSFCPQDISMSLSALAKLGYTDPRLLGALASAACCSLEAFGPFDLALVIWGLAALGRAEGGRGWGDSEAEVARLFASAAPLVASAAPAMSLQSLAMVVWSYGCCSRELRGRQQDIPFSATSFEVLEAVRPLLVDQADRMTAQGLVMTVHGYAAARHYAADVFAAVELQVLRRRVDAFTPQGLAQLLLAFAAVGDPGVGLFDAMVESVIKQIDNFTGQGLANVAYSYARMGQRSPELFKFIEGAAVDLLGSSSAGCGDVKLEEAAEEGKGLGPRDVASLLWAFAKVEYGSLRIFEAAEPTVSRMAAQEHICNREAANIMWAYASAGMAIPRLMVALANAAASSSSSLPQRPLSPRDLYHAVWASRRAGQVEAERGDQGFGPRLLVSLAPAFGTVDPSAFLSGPRLDAHELSSIAESYWPRANKEEEQGAGMDIGMRCELEAAAPAVLMALEACVRDEMAAEGFSAQEERILRLAYLQCCGRELPGRPRHMEVKLGDAAGREVAESGDAGLDGDVEAKAEKEGQRPLLRGKKPEVLRKPVPARAVQ